MKRIILFTCGEEVIEIYSDDAGARIERVVRSGMIRRRKITITTEGIEHVPVNNRIGSKAAQTTSVSLATPWLPAVLDEKPPTLSGAIRVE